MFQTKDIKIKHNQRLQKKQSRLNKNHYYLTPPKHQVKLSIWSIYYKLQEKFGYDYEAKDSKILKFMQQDFKTKAWAYLGNRQWTKKLGNKDKYQRNLKHGRPLKRNPLLTTFEKLENKIARGDKIQALNSLKSFLI